MNCLSYLYESSPLPEWIVSLIFISCLPLQSSKLVEVLSNIWGTKFRIVGTAANLPEDLGNVLYKTSLLHLQPRQMTVTVTEMPRDNSLLAQDPNFTPAGFLDDEGDGYCELGITGFFGNNGYKLI